MRKLFLLALMLGSVTFAAAAQDIPHETVEVKALPGPAVWHLTRGESEVWILGTIGALPRDLEWNKAYLSDLLEGARAIVMPPRPSIGILEGAWFLIVNGSKLSLPRGQALEATLPDDLRARFIATRTRLGEDEGEYRTDTPIRAAIRLQQDFRDKAKLSGREPNSTIASLARAKHVASAPIAKIEVLDAARDVLRLNIAQQSVCLGQSVEDVDQQSVHADIAARAWAIGDIKTVKAHYAESRLGDCVIAAVNSIGNIAEKNVADYTGAVDAALNQPGKTIVVIDMGTLLRTNGVLARLAAKKIAIEGPAE